ncbi:MAG: hypothetical protein KTR29_21200 [Rhodothermaceae bacterium]|nr:hypothetical protein [Rhodothermaceae bacterium]
MPSIIRKKVIPTLSADLVCSKPLREAQKVHLNQIPRQARNDNLVVIAEDSLGYKDTDKKNPST